MDEAIRVAIFFANDEERRYVKEALEHDRPKKTVEYNGVVEGWLTLDRANELVNKGFAVQLLDPQFRPAELSPSLTVPEEDFQELKAEARYASLEGEPAALSVADQEALSDPRIHQFTAYDQTPAPEDALPSDVYFISLKGPITRSQRLEFDSFGVDIRAFLPPNRYRTFLDREQYKRVRDLPYVEEVVRYRFEDAVTPELLALAQEAPPEGPSLLADEEELVQTFDCLLHRERDLPTVRELIEATEGARVLATSNLRIRFEAPISRPLLAALAGLPAVRKLSPYEPPVL